MAQLRRPMMVSKSNILESGGFKKSYMGQSIDDSIIPLQHSLVNHGGCSSLALGPMEDLQQKIATLTNNVFNNSSAILKNAFLFQIEI